MEGDRDAFAALATRVSDSLYAVAYRILRDPGLAEDALQNTLVTAWRNLDDLRDPDRFEAWIRRVLVHASYAEARRRVRRTQAVRQISMTDDVVAEDNAIIDRDEIERAFRRLSAEHRAVFVLHYYLGLPLVEVATTLGVPQGTARSRLHYAIRALRGFMQPERLASLEEGNLA